MQKILFAILSTIILACACSPKHTDDKPQGVLTNTQKQTLENARKTEDVLDKANKERMKEVDNPEGDK